MPGDPGGSIHQNSWCILERGTATMDVEPYKGIIFSVNAGRICEAD